MSKHEHTAAMSTTLYRIDRADGTVEHLFADAGALVGLAGPGDKVYGRGQGPKIVNPSDLALALPTQDYYRLEGDELLDARIKQRELDARNRGINIDL